MFLITLGGLSFVLGCCFLWLTIWISIKGKSPYWIMASSAIMIFVGVTFGVDQLNSDSATRQAYGQVFIIFISVMAGGLVSSAITEIRRNKLSN